jgi:hypothetical protein
MLLVRGRCRWRSEIGTRGGTVHALRLAACGSGEEGLLGTLLLNSSIFPADFD